MGPRPGAQPAYRLAVEKLARCIRDPVARLRFLRSVAPLLPQAPDLRDLGTPAPRVADAATDVRADTLPQKSTPV